MRVASFLNWPIGQLGQPLAFSELGMQRFASATLGGDYFSLLDVEATRLAIGTRERNFKREGFDTWRTFYGDLRRALLNKNVLARMKEIF
jgi:hypothetical protein